MTLKARREALGLTQLDVAIRAGMSPSTVSVIERGGVPNPGISQAVKLARSLEWTVEDVIAAIRESVEAAA